VQSVLGESTLQAFQDDFVKTFERVPGATIEGSGAAPGQEVEATVELEKSTGQTFEYTQYAEADENGNFELTVPYSTTGYDEFGPENGYTNTSVRATGPYNVTTEATTDDDLTTTQRVGQVEVTEGRSSARTTRRRRSTSPRRSSTARAATRTVRSSRATRAVTGPTEATAATTATPPTRSTAR